MKPTNTASCLKPQRSAPAHAQIATDVCHEGEILVVDHISEPRSLSITDKPMDLNWRY